MRVPLIALDSVFHVGTMDAADLGRNSGSSSQEGHCLSVSLCPNAWTTIARLGGNACHELGREGGTFLDVHGILADDETREAIVDWAIDQSLVERTDAWRAWRRDDETERWGYMTFATREEAEAEVDDVDEEMEDGRSVIERAPFVLGTPLLIEATGLRLDAGIDATDAAIMAWARRSLPDLLDRPVDGLWWNEDHDPDALSAPRGALFPERVETWKVQVVQADGLDDLDLLEGMPEVAVHEVGSEASPVFG